MDPRPTSMRKQLEAIRPLIERTGVVGWTSRDFEGEPYVHESFIIVLSDDYMELGNALMFILNPEAMSDEYEPPETLR